MASNNSTYPDNCDFGQSGNNDDPDHDGIGKAMEYALGTGPQAASTIQWKLTTPGTDAQISFTLDANRPDVGCYIQKAADANFSTWANLTATVTPGVGGTFVLSATDSSQDTAALYRLASVLLNQ